MSMSVSVPDVPLLLHVHVCFASMHTSQCANLSILAPARKHAHVFQGVGVCVSVCVCIHGCLTPEGAGGGGGGGFAGMFIVC